MTNPTHYLFDDQGKWHDYVEGQDGNDLIVNLQPQLASEYEGAVRYEDYLSHTKIHIAFTGFYDGRGFSLARRLRDLGYKGQLCAIGEIMPDQYWHLRRAGFDQVIIEAITLNRHGKKAWEAAFQKRQKQSYQEKLYMADNYI